MAIISRTSFNTGDVLTGGLYYWAVALKGVANAQIACWNTVSEIAKYDARTYTDGFPATWGTSDGNNYAMAFWIY